MTVEDFAARLEAVRKAEAETKELVFNPRDPLPIAGAFVAKRYLGSPIGAFLRERCTVAPGQCAQAQTLFDAWSTWCEAQGRGNAGTVQTFGRDLRAAVPDLKVSRPRETGDRARVYEGVGLG